MANHQHSTAYFVQGENVQCLKKANSPFDENWIQQFMFGHPESLPINEIEPAFGPLIPICRELHTNAGPVDIMFISPTGLITIVECKLWKNPEARRKVIGQILDYAKELANMSYSELENRVMKSKDPTGTSLFQIASAVDDSIDEQSFVDSVVRNLRRGRFQLIIAGDGIKEKVEQITSFLQAYGNLNFTLALIEYSHFRVTDDNFIVIPRILARTYEVERAVVRIEGDKFSVSTPNTLTSSKYIQEARTTISEQVFVESLQVEEEIRENFKALLQAAKQHGLYVDFGRGESPSLMLKSEMEDLNFAVFRINGTFKNSGIAKTTNELGLPEIGEQYLSELAKIIPDAFVNKGKDRFQWSVKTKKGPAKIEDLLAAQNKWLNIIDSVLEEFSSKYEKSA